MICRLVVCLFLVLALPALAAEKSGRAAGQGVSTELAKQSRSFFEKLVDLKIEDDLLVLRVDPSGGGSSAIFEKARSCFSNIGNVEVHYGGGGSSMSRGGSGSVSIRFESGGESGSFQFQLTAPGGNESLSLVQKGAGSLTIEYRQGKSSVSYVQAKGKCQLKIRSLRDSLSVSKRTFPAIFSESPETVRKYFLGLLEGFFDKVPVVHFAEAPPGKAVLHLRDGAVLVGELKLTGVRLQTDYGILTLPREEIRQIIFPGSEESVSAANPLQQGEVIVVMQRFTPKGRMELEAFEMVTGYGSLRVPVPDVMQVLFGPPAESAGAAEGNSGGTAVEKSIGKDTEKERDKDRGKEEKP